jgi:hypothetical protein
MKTFREYCEEKLNEAWDPEGAMYGFMKDVGRFAKKHGWHIEFSDPSYLGAGMRGTAIIGRMMQMHFYHPDGTKEKFSEIFPIIKNLMEKWDMVPMDKALKDERSPESPITRGKHPEWEQEFKQQSGWQLPADKWIETGRGISLYVNHISGNYERQQYGQDPRSKSSSFEKGEIDYYPPSDARRDWLKLQQSQERRKGERSITSKGPRVPDW